MNSNVVPIEAAPSRRLVQKLAEAGQAIGWIEKSGRNQFHNYNYATEADLVSKLRGELFSRNVFIFPTVISVERSVITVRSMKNGQVNERDTALTNVMVRWTFVDGDTGETMTCDMPGCGEDSGDKGVYKAMTGSEKYLLMKAFLIPTGDDPEKDSPVDYQSGREAAAAVGKAKVEAHKAKQTGDDSIEFVMGPAGMVHLKGDKGCNLLRSNAPETALVLMVRLPKANCWAVPSEKALSFYKLAQRHDIKVGVSNDDFEAIEEASVQTMAAPKANIPRPDGLSDSLDAAMERVPGAYEATDDDIPGVAPLILGVKSIKGKFVVLTWDGRERSCWHKSMWPLLAENQNKPAQLVCVDSAKDGKTYSNIEGLKSLSGVEYEKADDGSWRPVLQQHLR